MISISSVIKEELTEPDIDLYSCTKSSPETYKCNNCNLHETQCIVSLYEHIEASHSIGVKKLSQIENILQSYDCRDCNFQTFSLLMLMKHVYDKCKSTGCLSNIKRERRLEVHTQKTSNDQPTWDYKNVFECEQCSFRTKYKNHFNRHTEIKHTNKQTWWKCQRCSYKTVWKSDLKKHMSTHLDPEKTWFHCERCNYKTRQSDKFKLHAQSIHLNLQSCNNCRKSDCEQCSLRINWNNLKYTY